MRNGVPVGLGDVIQCSIITAWTSVSIFFITMCSGNDQLLDDGRMIPSSVICFNSCLATLSRSEASLRGYMLTGGPAVSMWCATVCLIK